MPKRKSNPTQQDRINELIVELLHVDASEITPGSKLSEDLFADSLDFVELTMILEEEFGMQIPDGDSEKLLTVQAIYDYVEDHADV